MDNRFVFGEKIINLNKEQKEIIDADINNNMRIIACAGSGKTTTLVCRIKKLIDAGIESNKIMMTTFNVDAAQTIKNRILSLFGYQPNILIGTLDSIACRFYFKYFKKDYFVGISEYSTELLNYLRSSKGKNILKQYEYIFFDEFQDCNEIQFNIIMEFYKAGTKIIVIGDDAQNIYQWRGSNIEYILNFDKYIPNQSTYKLFYNYRSTQSIVNLANNSIINNQDQIPKDMIAFNQNKCSLPTIKKYKSEKEQAEQIIKEIVKLTERGIPLEEIAIISRNNNPLKLIEEELERYNYLLNTIETEIDKNKLNTQNIIKKHSNFISFESSEEDSELDKKKLHYVALITEDKGDLKPKLQSGHITLTTIHKAKGLEWDVVFMVSCNDDKFPSEIDAISIQEERRLFYVAVTRAKTELYISFTDKYVTRFIKEIPNNLYNFDDFRKTYFNYKDKREQKYINAITEIIELLEPKDIEKLRDSNILISQNPNTKIIHNQYNYTDEINKYYLHSDYGIFIDRYITRLLGSINKKSKGLEDNKADLIINSLQVTSDLYAIYKKYKYNILKRINMIKNKNLESIYHTFVDKEDGDYEYVKKIEKQDIKLLNRLIGYIFEHSKKTKIPPKEILVIPFNYIPIEFKATMIESLQRYKSNNLTHEIIKDIYNVSLCENISSGRRRLLYKDVSNYFWKDKNLFTDIENKYIETIKNNDLECKRIIISEKYDLVGELDLVDKTNKKIIDYKCSITSHCKLEWIIQLLAYVSLLKITNNEIEINSIEIYNPILGSVTNFDISKWNKYDELLSYLSTLRNSKL